jgi:hypothetical protein
MTRMLNHNFDGNPSRTRLAEVRAENCHESVTSGYLHVAEDEKAGFGKPTRAGREFSLPEEKGRRAAKRAAIRAMAVTCGPEPPPPPLDSTTWFVGAS